MTTTQAMRYERRAQEQARAQAQRLATAKAIAIIAIALALMSVAGALDLYDRTEGLGASMVPSPEWQVMANG